MTATQQAVNMFDGLDQEEQDIALKFLRQLFEMHEAERKAENEAYLAKIRRGIKQCTEGRGIVHDIIEVEDHE